MSRKIIISIFNRYKAHLYEMLKISFLPQECGMRLPGFTVFKFRQDWVLICTVHGIWRKNKDIKRCNSKTNPNRLFIKR